MGKGAEGLAALILVPVLTRTFSPAEFGVWDVAMTFLVLVTTVTSFGLESAVAASFFESQQLERQKLVASTAVHFRLLSSIIIAAIVFGFAPAISHLIFDSPAYSAQIRIVAAIIPFFLFVNLLKQLLRIDFAPGKYNLVSIGNAACYAAVGIFLVVNMRMGINGILLGALVAGACFSLVGLVLTQKFLAFRFSGADLKAMLAFGMPLMPSLLAFWVVDFSDRYFLTQMSTLEQVGIFSVAAKISSIIVLFVTPFQMAWVPLALSLQHQPDAKQKYSNGLSFFLLAALALAAGIVIFVRPILMALAQPQYFEAQKIVAPLVLATIAFGAFLVLNIGLILTRKTLFTSLASGAAALLNLLLNFLLIPKFGIMGAAIATLISYVSAAVILYLLAQKEYHIPYDLSGICKLILMTILAMLLGTLIKFNSSIVLDTAFRTVLLAGLLFALFRIFMTRRMQTNEAG